MDNFSFVRRFFGSIAIVFLMSACTSAPKNPDYSGQVLPTKNMGPGEAPKNGVPVTAGDPVNFTNGNVYQEEIDYVGRGPFPLRLTRFHNSSDESGVHEFGVQWYGTYANSVSITSASSVSATRSNGRVFKFDLVGQIWTSESDVSFSLARVGSVIVLTTDNDEVETYNSTGQMITRANRAGLVQSFTYDGQGRLSTVKDPFGRTLSFSYGSTSSKLISAVTVPDGGMYNYSYDTKSNLIQVIRPDKSARKYLYQNSVFVNKLTKIVDEIGADFVSYEYDSKGWATSTTMAGGVGKFSFDYSHLADGQVLLTNPLGGQTGHLLLGIAGTAYSQGYVRSCSSCNNISYNDAVSFSYDTNGNITKKSDFKNNTTAWTYDKARNLEISRTQGVDTPQATTTTTVWHPKFRLPVQINEPHRVINFVYDNNGNALSIKISSASVNSVFSFTYNTAGQVVTVTDPNNRKTTFNYDSNGNLVSEINALGHTTSITSYDANGNPLVFQSPNGLVTTLTYDFRGNVTSKKVANQITIYAYNAVGKISKITLPDSSSITYSYDGARRLTGLADALGNYIVYTLDADGNRIKEEIFDSSKVLVATQSKTFDGFSRLTKIIGSKSQTTSVFYDKSDNLASVLDPLSNSTNNSYDPLDRLINVSDANAGNTSFGYDLASRLTNVTDPRNLETSYQYDGLNAVTAIQSPDSGATAKTYGPAGNLLTLTDARGKLTSFSYDALNRLIQVKYADGNIAVYGYDQGANAIGRLTSIADSSGTTTWLYDAYGRITQKKQVSAALTLSGTDSYDPSGRRIQKVYPSGRKVTYSYDADGRELSIAVDGQAVLTNIRYRPFGAPTGWNWGGGSPYSRTFDLDGQLTSFPLGASLRTLTYDTAGRITGSTDSMPLQRLSVPVNSVAYNVSPSSNQLMATTGSSVQTYAYDPAGNRLSDAKNGYSYDARGRLIQVTAGGISTRYEINSLGQRVAKLATNLPTGGQRFVYDDAGHLIGEYDNAGNPIQETIWLGDTPVAVIKPSGLFYVFADQLGTPRVITTPSLRTLWRWDSDPFGNGDAVATSDDAGVEFKYNLRFPGQYHDVESGLNYNYFRDYDSTAGRYVQSDPIGLAGGINTYAYVNGNPVSFIDPTGEFGIVGVAAGAAVDIGIQMLIKHRSISQIDWWSVGISAAAGAVSPGLLGASRAVMSSAYLAEKFAGLTLRDVLFVQGTAFSVSSLLKKEMKDKQASDAAYSQQCK